MYCAVLVFGGVIQNIKIAKNYDWLVEYVVKSVEDFDPSVDDIKIFDDEGNCLFSYDEYIRTKVE